MIENKLIIICGKDGRPSMKGVFSKMLNLSELHIRRRLINNLGKVKEYWKIFTNHNVDDFEKVNINSNDLTNKIIVRWGNRIAIDLTNSIVYNQCGSITLATNKKRSREIFIENNLNCPKLINKDNITNEDLPIIARPLVHSKGKNFIVLNSFADFLEHYNQNNNNWYYSAFVNKKQEFRLHVAHNRILNYLEKPKPADGNIAWNRALNEDPFVNIKWSDYNKDICKLAIEAVNVLELNFGAVDIMLTEDGKVYVLEVNTAGTLISSEYSMERYAKYFDWLCKTNKRREHWELKDYKKASNYAWHTYHFEDREPNKEI